MKITCSRNSSEYDLSKYIGKDVWIHVFYTCDASWLRIKSEGKDAQGYYYVVDYTADSLLNSVGEFGSPYTTVMNQLLYAHYVSIIQPIEVLTTAEMMNGDYKWSLIV